MKRKLAAGLTAVFLSSVLLLQPGTEKTDPLLNLLHDLLHHRQMIPINPCITHASSAISIIWLKLFSLSSALMYSGR